MQRYCSLIFCIALVIEAQGLAHARQTLYHLSTLPAQCSDTVRLVFIGPDVIRTQPHREGDPVRAALTAAAR